MAARLFIGGDLHGRTDFIWDEVPSKKHPRVVLVYLWEEDNRSYRIKTYTQANPEET